MARGPLRLVVVGLLAAVLVAGGAPAWADPAGPTHFRSTITEVEAPEGVAVPELEILGGDAFLVVRAAPGSTVEVPGYEGEPYVRVDADGTVELNERSPARYLNDARYGEAEVEVPASADADAPPTWTVVADDGEYAWHDHRIHFMSPVLPPQVDTGAGTVQPVMDFSVPLTVDGVDVEVVGELVWLPGPSPAVPIAIVVGLLAAGVALAVRAPGAVRAATIGAAVVAAAIGLADVLGQPAGADGDPALVILPVVAVALVAVGTWVRGQGQRLGELVGAAAGVPLTVWGVLLAGALTRPIVPLPLPAPAVRVVVAVVLAVGVAGIVLAGRALLAVTALRPEADAHDPAVGDADGPAAGAPADPEVAGGPHRSGGA